MAMTGFDFLLFSLRHNAVLRLYTRIVLRALKVFYSDLGEGGVAVNCEKNTFFPEHPVLLTKLFRKGESKQVL